MGAPSMSEGRYKKLSKKHKVCYWVFVVIVYVVVFGAILMGLYKKFYGA